MMDGGKLKFDTMEVNTELAKEYISSHNGEFGPWGYKKSEKFEVDNANNKLYSADQKIVKEELRAINRVVLEKFAQKIEENAELFSQLEALIRKKSKEEVKSWDIQLIVQNLLYHSAQEFAYEQRNAGDIYFHNMGNNSPLASVGHVIEKLFKYKEVVICAAQNVGVVCHLFTKLCHEVGLTQVQLQFIGSSEVDTIRDVASGCFGVITAQSDIDSAVDILLASTVQYPWKLECVLVQESVYESVRTTFKGKSELKTSDPKFKACTDAMTHGNKTILFDNAAKFDLENEQGIDVVILVEAYRTTKELISLVNKEQPFCVSLWCSCGAEADEIAFSVHTQVVWINEFGSFWGPPDASQAFYSVKQGYVTPLGDSDVDKHTKVIESWKKVDMKSRRAIVNDVIRSCADRGDSKERVLNLIRKRWSEKESFVEIQNKRMCIGERKLGDILLHVETDIEEAIAYLISGKAVIVRSADAVYKDWLEALAKKGLPVIFKFSPLQTSVVSDKRIRNKLAVCESNTKVVYKNFGTIFAN